MARRPTSGTTHGAPSEWMVQIEEITPDGAALCIDAYGASHYVPHRAMGTLPQPGEFWLLRRHPGGAWNFSSRVGGELPEITGSVEEGSVLDQVLVVLASLGHVTDSVTRT